MRGTRPLKSPHYAYGVTLLLLGLAMQSGCVSTTIQQIREVDTDLNAGHVVAILGRLDRTKNETELNFVECISDKTQDLERNIRVIDNQAFLDEFFPWFEPRTAPRDTGELKNLLTNPRLATRFREQGVKYIVWIDGTTQRTDQSGTVQCAMTAGGVPTCFGFLSWDSESSYEASVWDVEQGITAGKLSSEVSGTSFVPAIIVPIPFVARVRASACNSLSSQLQDFLTG